MGSPRERQPVREGALTIQSSDKRFENNKPPGPLPPTARIERVDTPVYVDRDTRATRTTVELTLTVNTPGELYALMDRVAAELRAAEAPFISLGEIKVIHRNPALLKPPRTE